MEPETTESEFVADIEDQLYETFINNPDHRTDASGQPSIPGYALISVLRDFSESYGVDLLNSNEETQLVKLLDENPEIECTPAMILMLAQQRAKETSSPSRLEQQQRGRRSRAGSRSSSREPSMVRNSAPRPPSKDPGPNVPATPTAFDKRQRSGPLVNPPSSWSKPLPASRRKSVDKGRRKSIDGTTSDSDQNPSPLAYKKGRSNSNAGVPPLTHTNSEPTITYGNSNTSGIFSPPSSYHNTGTSSGSSSRPGSRQGHSYFSSPEPNKYGAHHVPPPLDLSELNSIPLPHASGHESDDDSDEDLPNVPMWSARAGTVSTMSMEDEAKIAALTVASEELARKLREQEDLLSRRMAEHESELEELTGRLEETKADLMASRKEEKELRAKERAALGQIHALESEVQRLQRQVEAGRASYEGLQKQYREQLMEAERVRNSLRDRDMELHQLRDGAALGSLEAGKWAKERDTYEDRIGVLEGDLVAAAAAHASLEDQKQENMMLKETIDRLKYEMDELRIATAGTAKEVGGSREATMSRSLGAEMGRVVGQEKWDEDRDESEETETVVGPEEREVGSSSDEETEIQTIITKRTKKSRANKVETIRIEDNRTFCDAYTQHDASGFITTSSTQTDPEPIIQRASFSVQATASTSTMEIQTDPEPEPVPAPTTSSMEIQTDPEPTPAPVASSSKRKRTSLGGTELPPAYDEHSRGIDALTKTHPGAPAVLADGVPQGIISSSVQDWVRLKKELGMSCGVIDAVVEGSTIKEDPAPPTTVSRRFWSIKAISPALSGNATNVLMCMGASAAVMLVLGPAFAPPQGAYGHGGPGYYDRVAWSAFNGVGAAGEGFPGVGDGTGMVWGVLGRLGGGAARRLGGWPT